MRTKQVTIDVAKIRELMVERNMSQTVLAQSSRLSRGYLVNLLHKDCAKVRRGTADKLSRALQMPVEELDIERVENEYLTLVTEQHKYMEFGGLGIVYTGPSIPFDRGFVQLLVEENQLDEDYPLAFHQPSKEKASIGPKLPPFSIGKALQRSRQCCLLGDPGCGKTTVLRHIARAYALRRHEEHSYPVKPSIPIFIRVAAWGEQLRENEDVGVVEAALSQIAISDNNTAQRIGKWLAEQIDKQNIVLLLDGLDEVVEPEIQSLLLEKIRSFVNAHPDARVVVTSRVVGFEATNLRAYFTIFKIQPLPVKASGEFVKEWFAFRHGHSSKKSCDKCESRTEQLMNRIAAKPQISEIAGNPLMLTILALLYEAGGVLPQRRWDLYQKISEAFLFSWEESKRSALSGTIDHGVKLDNREILWLLESVAIEMQRNDWTLVARWWLSRHFNSFLRDNLGYEPDKARNEAEALIWSLQERAGLLVERGAERYGFSHLAFQEYFAASAIMKESDPVKALKPYFYHPRWREVVCLVAAQLDWRQLPKLLRSILDDPDPTGRFLQRGLLLTLSCLADSAPLNDDTILKQIRLASVGLGRTKWLGTSLDVLAELDRLDTTRLKNFASRTINEIFTTAKQTSPSWMYWGLRMYKSRTGDAKSLLDVLEEGSLTNSIDSAVIEISLPGDPPIGFPVPMYSEETQKTKWEEKLLNQLKGSDPPEIRAVCAEILEAAVEEFSKVRKRLMEILLTQDETAVRQAIVKALTPVSERPEVRELLKDLLKSDVDEDVRSACAHALELSAAKDESTKQLLVSTLLSVEPPPVRAGCALGLSRAAMKDNDVRDLLLENMKDKSEDEQIRIACLISLVPIILDVAGAVELLKAAIESSPGSDFAHVAAVFLGGYAMTGRIKWGDLPVDKIEHVLMNIEEPFSAALTVLRGLIDGREIRKLGVPREERIRRALSQFTDRIEIMFIFGSSAKDTQGLESDIDLLIVGDVSLKELIPGLRHAEQELGKEVNAVIYSQEEWHKRLREGNPFVKNISKEEKIFITGGPNELAGMVG